MGHLKLALERQCCAQAQLSREPRWLVWQSSQGQTAEDMRLLALLLTFLMAALTMAVPMEIPAKSADYAKYSLLQGPTFYARTEIGPPVPLPQAQSQGW